MTPMNTEFATTSQDFVHTQDSGWGLLQHMADAAGRAEQIARAETLQHSAMASLAWGDAQTACWYLARSLGVAKDLPPNAGPVLLRELNAALAARHVKPLEGWGAFNANTLSLVCHELARQRAMAAHSRYETAPSNLVH